MYYTEDKEELMLLSKEQRIIVEFRKFVRAKKWFLLITFLAVCLGFVNIYNSTHYYQSQAIISFSGIELPEYKNDAEGQKIPDFANMGESYNRMYQIIFSKEMMDHIIQKFDLYSHNSIDPKAQNGYLKVRRVYKNCVNLIQGTNRTLSIIVRDYGSNKMASDIANEIVNKSDEMNKSYIRENLTRRIKLYDILYNDVKSRTTSDTKSLNESIGEMKSLLSKYKSDNIAVQDAGNRLTLISNSIETNLLNLMELSKIYNWDVNSLKNDNIVEIKLLQEALPDDSEENISLWILIPLSVLASVLISVFLFYIIFLLSPYVNLFFKSTKFSSR